jgi:hypothetical protein
VRLPRAALSRLELPLLALWAGLALALSALTTRVEDWFVMTDELLYERLALSVWQLASPLPHVHGELIPNLNQLYPLLIAPAFGGGLVPGSLDQAHAVNAWVMSSACIPAFLLARRVTGRRCVAYALAVLTVCLPWIALSSFLLTEVAGYPAFLWAVLAMQAAIASPSRRNDVLALLGIALAVFARTQFELLLVVLPAALLAVELVRGTGLRGTLRRHAVLAWAYGALLAGAVVLLALGAFSRVLGTYRGALEGSLVPGGIGRSFLEHTATLALGLGILPFVVGVAWLLANAVRPPAREPHTFACLASITVGAVALEVTVFDQRFGDGSVRDRYLFYVAPLVLLGFLCALADARWPRRSLLAPTALVAAGFALDRLPVYGIFHADSPIAVLHDRLRDAFDLGAARTLLAAGTVLVVALFALLARRVPHRYLAPALAALTLVVLPLQTAYAFARLFEHNGTSGRPVSLSQGVVFNWIDRTIGPGTEVTLVPYPSLPGEYFASVGLMWDTEFWNRSIVRAAYRRGEFEWTPSTFPRLYPEFDAATGGASISPTRYVAQSDKETRFRIAGTAVSDTRGLVVTEAEQPWRTDWLSFGLTDDGWSRPGVPVTVRVFAEPGQRGPRIRSVAFGMRAPEDVATRPVDFRTNLEHEGGTATNGATAYRVINACVPAKGYADYRITVSGSSPVYGDMRSQATIGEPRDAGVLFTQIALADEVGPPCTPAKIRVDAPRAADSRSLVRARARAVGADDARPRLVRDAERDALRAPRDQHRAEHLAAPAHPR